MRTPTNLRRLNLVDENVKILCQGVRWKILRDVFEPNRCSFAIVSGPAYGDHGNEEPMTSFFVRPPLVHV
ncbi:hypothetical protein C447_14376 [Halococcus hamelinensis 100A6]|uniref:Uncharacterized protein n=1 Tax=Halococcus hamelinensis 100A6 TaxID=1132509 RepID=M0LTI1_9EURY|nr:hypothetical protein C447_14376 [Halococcus hamelinensis 100A6]